MNTVISKDGTRIGYTSVGEGPGLILVQGALGTAHNYRDLAQALASDFTVFTPDRRGRGMSPKPFTPGHTIQGDVEDIEALCQHTDAASISASVPGQSSPLPAPSVSRCDTQGCDL